MSSYFQDSVTDQIDTATLIDQLKRDQMNVQNGGGSHSNSTSYGLMRGGSGRLFSIDDPDIYFDSSGRPVVGNMVSPLDRFNGKTSQTTVLSGGGNRRGRKNNGNNGNNSNKSKQIYMLHQRNMRGSKAAQQGGGQHNKNVNFSETSVTDTNMANFSETSVLDGNVANFSETSAL